MAAAGGIRAGSAYVEIWLRKNRLVRGLKQTQARLKAFGASVSAVGRKMMTTGVALGSVFALPIVAAVRAFADFEKQLANVSTMLQEPALHMDTFRRELRRMSAEFGESTEALSGGLYDILSASFSADDALTILTATTKAAIGGMTDTATATDAVTTVLNAYGLAGTQAGDVSDLLFSIVKRGKTTFGELAVNIGKVASTANTAGVSLEELGGMVALMTRKGIKTEEAMTAVQAIVKTFLKPSPDSLRAAAQMGITLDTATLKNEGLLGVLKRLEGVDPKLIARIFPNVRALKGVFPLLASLGEFEQDIDTMTNRAGAAETAYTKMTKTLAFQFAKLKQGAIAAMSAIGESLAEPMGKLATAVSGWVTKLMEWVDKNQGLVQSIGKVAMIVIGFAAALIVLGGVGMLIGGMISGLGSIVGLIAAPFALAAKAVGLIGTALTLLLSPMGLVVAGIALVGWAIVEFTKTGADALKWFGDRFKELQSDAVIAFDGIAAALSTGDLSGAAEILWLSLKVAYTRGINGLMEIVEGFKTFFLSIWTELSFGASSLFASGMTGVEKAWEHSIGFLQDLWHSFTALVKLGWSSLVSGIMQIWNKTKGLVDGRSQEEIDAEDKRIVDAAAAEQSGVANEWQTAMAKRDRERQKRLRNIEQRGQDTQKTLDEQRQAEHDARTDQRNKNLAGVRADLRAAEKARDARAKAATDAVRHSADAAKERGVLFEGEGEGEDEADGFESGQRDLSGGKRKDQLDALQNRATALESVRKTAEVKGTFSAFAVRGMQTGGPMERIAKATESTAASSEETAENTGNIALPTF